MTERTCDIAIIGAGTAGLHAYKWACDAGMDYLVIERGEGGSLCTRSGCIPSKLLIAAGRAAHRARRADTFGVRVGAVEIDGAAVMARLRRIRDEADGGIRDEYRGIPAERRIHGVARLTDTNTIAVGETTIRAKKIVVATGSKVSVPAALDGVADLVRTNETIFALEALPRAMAVIGAGPLGLELAQAFARLGVEVTVLDKSETIGAIADPEGERCARAALARELTIVTGVDVAAELAGDRARVSWDGGAVEVDLILAASGRVPNVDELDLAAAGIMVDEDGVPLIEEGTRRCGEAAVFVAGDANGWRPVLHEAARGGRIAADVANGAAPWRPLPNLAIAFTEPNIVQVGTTFGDLPDGARIGTAHAGDDIRAQIDAEDEGVVRLYADADGTLIGGTIVAYGGEHLGQTLALAIERGIDAATFADEAWYHPVIEEMLQAAARDV